jgi:hypothetical protein
MLDDFTGFPCRNLNSARAHACHLKSPNHANLTYCVEMLDLLPKVQLQVNTSCPAAVVVHQRCIFDQPQFLLREAFWTLVRTTLSATVFVRFAILPRRSL